MRRFRFDRQARARLATATLALGTVALAACSGGGGSSGGRTAVAADQSLVATGPIEIVERYIAYLADESKTGPAPGTNYNASNGMDTDFGDSIAVVANAATGDQRVLEVAADDLALVRTVANGTHLFIVTREADDTKDWDIDGNMDDLVLLHTNVSTASPLTFVALLKDAAVPTDDVELFKVDDRVYFTDDAALLAPETSLLYVDTAAALSGPPATSWPIRVNGPTGTTFRPEIMTEDEGLIFLTLDEANEGMLNGDIDTMDADVLALLDGTTPGNPVVCVPLALQDDSTPVRALRTGSTWIVGFLVDETGEGVNLNAPGHPDFAPSWQPIQCVGFDDTDTTDEVLHFLDFDAFVMDPVTDPPVNTGLVGDDRVLVVEAGPEVYVATVSNEADEGPVAGGCDLNLNGDTPPDDDVLRWAEAVLPVAPFTSSTQLLALADVNGGTEGVTALNGRFVAVVSESEEMIQHDSLPAIDDLVAWLDPTAGAAAVWEFDHDQLTAGIQSVGTGSLNETDGSSDRLGVAFPEAFFLDSMGNPKSINGPPNGPDTDTADSVPTFMRFNGAGTELDFPGPAVATSDLNAGIEIVGNLGFYRVDENADSRDWNGDDDFMDFVLFRTTVSTLLQSNFVGTVNDNPGPSIILPDPDNGNIAIAFVADEVAAGKDLNGDMDSMDLVLSWFRVD